jgi:hypothetical protein
VPPAKSSGELSSSSLTRFGSGPWSRAPRELAPWTLAGEIITGIDGPQSAIINGMRHGQMLESRQSLYASEVRLPGYPALQPAAR